MRASEGGWLAGAGERAALPRGKRREDYAVEVRTDLLERQNSQAHKIMARTSSRERIDGWAGLLKQPQVRFFAYCPQDAIGVFGAGLRELQRWSTLAEIYEACYARCDQSVGARSELPYGERLSAAQLSRTRWVLLSQPFVGAARPERVDLWYVNDEPGRLVALAQQARDDWLTVLAAIDDYPLLAARIGDLERDAVTLAITQVTEAVLDLDPSSPADHDDPVGREAASYAVTRLLLPRFAWAAAARAYLRWASRLSRALSGAAFLAVIAVLVQLMIAFWLPWTPGYTAAAITAAAVYPLIGFAMAAEPGAAWPWLLRQPASAAVGLLALAAFGTTWWYTGSSRGEAGRAVLVMGGLAAAALLYLYFEAIGHGVRGWRLAAAAWVTLLGLMHGLLISLIGLRFLLPFFASAPPRGPQLSCWYSAGACHGLALPVPLLLGLAAAWSLAAGVFLQIIWDSEPVTAPLAHVSWRRGG